MIKLGIIGLGRMGGYHASVTQLIGDIKLVGIADPNEKNWKKIKSDKVIKSKDYNDWIDLVEAVIIAVPTEQHYFVAKSCLSRGIHVLVEKPLTKNSAQAIELFQIAKKNNCALHIGHVERFNGAVQEVKKIIQTPYLIECHRIGPFAPRVQNDSVVLDLMIHDLDLVINLINSPVKIVNIVDNKVSTQLSDIAVVQLAFENGVIANIVSSRASQTKQRTMVIHQKDSFVKLDFTTQDISIHRHASDSVKVGKDQLRYKQESTIERLFVYKDNPLKLEVENFIKAVETGKSLSNSKKDLAALSLTLKLEKLVEQKYNDCNNSGQGEPTNRSVQESCTG